MTEVVGLLERVDKAVLRPVDSKALSFGSVSPEVAGNLKRSSLSFSAVELLTLTPEQVFQVSKRVRVLFTKIASQNGLRINPKDLEQFKDNDDNSILHELTHIRRIQELRPELIEGASVNVLPLLHAGLLNVAMNTMVSQPEVPYTIVEKLSIQMAPNLPSDPDYFDLQRYIEGNTYTKEDLERVKELVNSKRRSHGKEHFLEFLSRLWYNTSHEKS